MVTIFIFIFTEEKKNILFIGFAVMIIAYVKYPMKKYSKANGLLKERNFLFENYDFFLFSYLLFYQRMIVETTS
jgi:hypothetical protein